MDAETTFAIDDIETVIKSSIGSVLTDTQYNPTKVNDQVNSIVSATLKGKTARCTEAVPCSFVDVKYD